MLLENVEVVGEPVRRLWAALSERDWAAFSAELVAIRALRSGPAPGPDGIPFAGALVRRAAVDGSYVCSGRQLGRSRFTIGSPVSTPLRRY
jgi:hypothetical protein